MKGYLKRRLCLAEFAEEEAFHDAVGDNAAGFL
jgi:hypothetical protein